MTKLILDSVTVRDFNTLELLAPLLDLSYGMQTTSTACSSSEIPSDLVTCDSAVCNKFYVETLTEDDRLKVLALGYDNPGLVFEDYTVLYIAHRDGTELVTGDKCMRRIAGQMHVVTRDYMWVLEEMIAAGILDITVAIPKYAELHATVNPGAIWYNSVTSLHNAYERRRLSA